MSEEAGLGPHWKPERDALRDEVERLRELLEDAEEALRESLIALEVSGTDEAEMARPLVYAALRKLKSR